jgi:hypothetical protein
MDAVLGCADRTADDTSGIFVEGGVGADTGTCGDRQTPCRTIASGIAQARTFRKSVVYVARGLYVETIALAPGIRVEGGWAVLGTKWSPLCSDASTGSNDGATIQAPNTSNITVMADALGGEAALARITIKSKDAANPSQSLYGVFARGADTRLLLDNVQIIIARAGDGTAGTDGTAGADGAAAGCTSSSDGSNGETDGAAGTGAAAGTFGSGGYVSSDGTAGSDGKAGHNGAPSPAGECLNCYDCLICDGDCQQAPCLGSLNGTVSCGSAGKAGCSGTEGKAGNGSHGGGSSVGLYTWNSAVSIVGGVVQAGDGGRGPAGGLGGRAGQGAAGFTGTAGSDCTLSCPFDCNIVYGHGSGGTGGKGGNGTKGGQGGGGAGGFSFALFKGGTGQVVTTGTVLVHGAAGASLGNGAAGQAGDIGP